MQNELNVPLRYLRVSPRDEPRRSGSYGKALSLAMTPLLGSRLFFPRSFDDAVRRLRENHTGIVVPPHRARWYFGSLLQFDVDPASLDRRISDYVRDRRGLHWVGTSFLDAADWSAALAPLGRSPIHREMSELVAADLDFRSIRAYRNFLHALSIGRPVRRNGIRLTGPEEVAAYFHYCIDLIVSMRKHGAVARRNFASLDRAWLKHREARPPALDSAERDIGVAIDADGELIRHLGGKHRTAIAQALRLPSIPVELRLVHVGWLAEEMRRTGQPAHLALANALRSLSAGAGMSSMQPGRDGLHRAIGPGVPPQPDRS